MFVLLLHLSKNLFFHKNVKIVIKKYVIIYKIICVPTKNSAFFIQPTKKKIKKITKKNIDEKFSHK
jgi:hypothetical protein